MMLVIHLSQQQLNRLICCLLGMLILFSYLYFNYNRKATGPVEQLAIVIDPGHGGVDGGTRDEWGNLEKEINLKIALKIREQLLQSGAKVVMTRDQDVDLAPFIVGKSGRHRRDLLGRIKKAIEANCLCLVSIHCDWSKDTNEQGVVVFYNYQSSISKSLASFIQSEINQLQRTPRKTAPGKFLIIRQKALTAALVEVGFLSNRNEAKLLQEGRYQNDLALAIARGILAFRQNQLKNPG